MDQPEVYGIRLWVDSFRAAPKGWVWCKSLVDAKTILRNAVVGRLSFNWPGVTSEGIRFVQWMAENNLWPSQKPDVHTNNLAEGYYLSKMIDDLFPGKQNLVVLEEALPSIEEIADEIEANLVAMEGGLM